MNFFTQLDKWLTMPPEQGFDIWVEQVTDNYADHVDAEWYDSELENKWLNKLFAKQVYPEKAAEVIGRAYSLYKIQANDT